MPKFFWLRDATLPLETLRILRESFHPSRLRRTQAAREPSVIGFQARVDSIRSNMWTRSFATLASLLLLPITVRATCYTLDGSEYTDSSYVACNSSSQYSACCASSKGTRSDICMSSGLCYAQDGKYRGFIYMNGCTDSTGRSDACPHVCPDG